MQGPFSNSIQALGWLFGITGEKRYPQAQADFVQPTVDVWDACAGPQLATYRSTVSITGATGGGLFNCVDGFVIPAGQVWWMTDLSVWSSGGMLASEMVRGKGYAFIPGPGASIPIFAEELWSSWSDAAASSAPFPCADRHFERPAFLPPGTQFGFQAERFLTAGTISLNVAVRALVTRI